jgi:hypothetical protein
VSPSRGQGGSEMRSPDEMRSPAGGPSAADVTDDDFVLAREDAMPREPGPPQPATGSEARSMPPQAAGEGRSMPPQVAGEGRSMPPRAASEAPAASPVAAGASRTAPRVPDDRRWREIQAMFVDDPRDSLQQAADLINTAIEESLTAIRRRQAVLASSWQERSADTEALRIALKDYRALWTVVRDMPVAGANGVAAGQPGVGGSSFGGGPSVGGGPDEPGRGSASA